MSVVRRAYRRLLTREAPSAPSDALYAIDSGTQLGLDGFYDQEVALAHVDTKWGDMASDSALIFMCLAVKSGFSPVVEFGTFRGRTTYNLALNARPDARIYTIDVGDSTDEDANVEGRGYGSYVPGELIRNAPSVIRDKVTMIAGDSRTVDVSELFEGIGLVLVDGGHTYEVCASDSLLAFRLLKKGGMIVWDDYHPYWPGVKQCIDELAVERRLTVLKREGLVVYLNEREEK